MVITLEYFGSWHPTYKCVCTDQLAAKVVGCMYTHTHIHWGGGKLCRYSLWPLVLGQNSQDANTDFLNISLWIQKNEGMTYIWCRRQGRDACLLRPASFLNVYATPPTRGPCRDWSSLYSCCEIQMNKTEKKKSRQWQAGKQAWLFLASFSPIQTQSF